VKTDGEVSKIASVDTQTAIVLFQPIGRISVFGQAVFALLIAEPLSFI